MEKIKIVRKENVYEPKEDSYLMLKHVNVKKGEVVLDMGCGTGIIGILSAKQGGKVFCIDINRDAVLNAEENAKRNGVKVHPIVSDLFSCIKNIKFDKIFFNPPYIAEEPTDIYSRSWAGGNNMEVVFRFLKEAKNFLKKDGEIYLLISSLGLDEEIKKFAKMFYIVEEVDEEKFFFEKLTLLKLRQKGK